MLETPDWRGFPAIPHCVRNDKFRLVVRFLRGNLRCSGSQIVLPGVNSAVAFFSGCRALFRSRRPDAGARQAAHRFTGEFCPRRIAADDKHQHRFARFRALAHIHEAA